MAATVVIVFIAVLVGIILSGSPEPVNLGTSSSGGYSINLNVTSKTTDIKRLALTAEILQRRLETISKEPVKIRQSGDNTLTIELAGSVIEPEASRLVSGRGLVEFVLVNGEALKEGEAIQTSFCATGSLQQPRDTGCENSTNENAQTDSKGQPFQTILTNAEVSLQPGQPGVKQLLAELTQIRIKLLSGYPKLSVAIVIDGKVLSSVQLTNMTNPKEVIGLSTVDTIQGKKDLAFLNTLLNYGAVPLNLEVAQITRF